MTERKLDKSNENIYYQTLDENLFYEISQKLTLDQLRNFCNVNRKTNIICQTERFRELIHKKIIENERRKEIYYDELVNKIYDIIRKTNTFQYDIIKLSRLQNHYISYSDNNEGKPALGEFLGLKNKNYAPESILKNLFDQKIISLNIFGHYDPDGSIFILNYPTVEEIKKVLHVLVRSPHFDINNLKVS